MQHHIRTAHGDSKTYYSGSFYKPLQGGGQGNRAAGPMWLAISIVMLAIIDNFHIGATLVATISLSTIYITAVMYVEDTDLLLSGKKGEESPSLKKGTSTRSKMVLNPMDNWRLPTTRQMLVVSCQIQMNQRQMEIQKIERNYR